MTREARPRARVERRHSKVIGLGAPVSVLVYLEVAEIPALKDAIADQVAHHGGSAQIDGRTVQPEAGVDPTAWRDHVGELRRMLGDVERGPKSAIDGRFSVLWPSSMAYDVIHGALAHAEQRASTAGDADAAAARAALAAAGETAQDFEAVDGGGSADVWL